VDLEAPADAWYVWLGVAAVSVGLAGIVVGLPSGPPPDAAGLAGTIDRVAATEHTATAATDHDATEVRIGPERLTLRNDEGVAHARISFGQMVHVRAVASEHRETLLALLDGTTAVDDRHRELLAEIVADHPGVPSEWYPAQGRLQVRSVAVGGQTVLLVVA
jgi:hypothetical protein